MEEQPRVFFYPQDVISEPKHVQTQLIWSKSPYSYRHNYFPPQGDHSLLITPRQFWLCLFTYRQLIKETKLPSDVIKMKLYYLQTNQIWPQGCNFLHRGVSLLNGIAQRRSRYTMYLFCHFNSLESVCIFSTVLIYRKDMSFGQNSSVRSVKEDNGGQVLEHCPWEDCTL